MRGRGDRVQEERGGEKGGSKTQLVCWLVV